MAIAAVAPALSLFAERQPYERYQPIVDRQMFGQPPPGFDPTKPPSEVSAREDREKEQELSKEQEKVKSAIHFSVINRLPSGETAVGFTDNSDSKNPVHYYLKVGESRNGWTVKEADPLKASMTIAKDDVEVSLELGGNSANGGSKGGGDASGGSGRMNFSGRSSLLGGRLGGSSDAGSRGLGSLRERRAIREQRMAAEAQAAEEEKKRLAQERAEEKAQREQENAQREQEREEQRAQLMQIQEELRKAREERAKADAEKAKNDEGKEGDESS